MRTLGLVSFVSGIAMLATLAPGQTHPGPHASASATAATAVKYRVNYRPSDADPWQLYAQSRDLSKANAIAAEVRQTGYQAGVVDDATPVPQFYPDATDTSASGYYPTSNWAADYNQCVVPGGNYGYGW
jgi:hypothetical protein